MRADAASRRTFGKNSLPGFAGQMALTERGLVLGAGTLLAKLVDKARPIEADQERIWTLLSVAHGEEISRAVFGSLRRAAKHWHSGDKCFAAIQLARMGLPDIGEDAAYRLSLAAELIGAGVAPCELARELGFDPAAGLVKYDPDEPRVPAGSGRWTPSGMPWGWCWPRGDRPRRIRARPTRRLPQVAADGPIPAVHGGVRWRRIDLAQGVFEALRISISKQPLSRAPRRMGFRKLARSRTRPTGKERARSGILRNN